MKSVVLKKILQGAKISLLYQYKETNPIAPSNVEGILDDYIQKVMWSVEKKEKAELPSK